MQPQDNSYCLVIVIEIKLQILSEWQFAFFMIN